MSLRTILSALETMAPLSLAGSWDNVGLLVSHSLPVSPSAPYKVLLTNDISMGVLEHSLTCFDGSPASMILSYHPTPFSALKKFSLTNPASRVVLTAAAHNMAIFSPHTSWDAAPKGLNDWLIEGVVGASGGSLAEGKASPVKKAVGPLGEAGAGDGRVGTLVTPLTLGQVVAGVKRHLKLAHVALSLPSQQAAAVGALGPAAVLAAADTIPIHSVAVCAGSGGGVLGGLTSANVWITGELGHHELLAASAAGVAVILTHHSNCERGYLHVVAQRLKEATQGENFQFLVSPIDADPLTTV